MTVALTNVSLSNMCNQLGVDTVAPFSYSNLFATTGVSSYYGGATLPGFGNSIGMGIFRGVTKVSLPAHSFSLDARNLALANNATVQTWGSFSQATAASRPTYLSTGGGIAGTRPYVRFSSTTNMILSTPFSMSSQTNGGRTFLFLACIHGTIPASGINMFQFDASGQYFHSVVHSGQTYVYFGTVAPINQTVTGMYATGFLGSTTQWAVFALRETNSTLLAEGFKFTTRTTASTVKNGLYKSQSMGTTHQNMSVTAGSLNTSGTSGPLSLSALQIFDRPLTDAQLALAVNQMMDTPSPSTVFNIGAYNVTPWGAQNYDTSSVWIWSTSGARTSADSGTVPFYQIYYSDSYADIPVTIYVAADNSAIVYMNDTLVGTVPVSPASFNGTPVSISSTLKFGWNTLQINATNTEPGAAGLFYSVKNGTQRMFGSVTSATTQGSRINSLATPVIPTRTYVSVLGVYNMSPWLSPQEVYQNTGASWVWSTANAQSSAAAGTIFFRQEYNNTSGSSIPVTISIAVDNYGTVYLNGALVGSIAQGSASWATPVVISTTLVTGLNTLRVEATNESTSPAGILYAVKRTSDNVVLFRSDANVFFFA